jgi:hypothetical protein
MLQAIKISKNVFSKGNVYRKAIYLACLLIKRSAADFTRRLPNNFHTSIHLLMVLPF